jgi:glycine/D-amino acid oxidase-like deaminating enzyme/nitrite reductase/ring-hydroxylating ferredoxin subunit
MPPTLPAPHSLWLEGEAPNFPALSADLDVDVAIIGGGITGLTAAVLLKASGKRVAVIEARDIGHGTTGGTSAHLTEAIDTRYHTLEKDFGQEGTRLVASASKDAIATIERLARTHASDCDFERLPGYLYSERESDLGALHAEWEAAGRAGLDVQLARESPLPFPVTAAIRFGGQAAFHPFKYVRGLSRAADGEGSFVHERTRALEIHEGDRCRVVTEHGVVTAESVIMATHTPLNRLFLQTKIGHYQSYVVAVETERVPPRALYWDTDDPYHYTRLVTDETDRNLSLLIVGGEDHRTGAEADTEARYAALLSYADAKFGVKRVVRRWSAQLMEPVDGLPYIGHNSGSSRVFVATGYSGNGLTFGTIAGTLLPELIAGREHPWASLFSATRVKPVAAAVDFLEENAPIGMYMVGDRLRGLGGKVEDVAPGQGKVLVVDGKRLALYREPDGALHAVSAICPHLGCVVHWNDAERTWDCPCHGSRFTTGGAVLEGPSLSGLAPVATADTARAK